MKVRQVIAFKNYFENFLSEQPKKVQDKIFKIIQAVETLERIPSNYLKHLTGTDGLYEARIQLGSDIWRVFCFFDGDKLVILSEIEKAMKIRVEYHEQKRREHGN